jgi:hypothetical protein
MRNPRIWIAGGAAALALCTVSAAVLEQNAVRQREEAVSLSAEVSAPDTDVYLVRTYSGELCVFQNGVLLERTGIPVSTLPQSDRALAAVGISVTGQAALSELLGDLGS